MEAKTFAKDFFSISNDKSQENNLTDHEEWLLREYAKLMKKDSELKEKEKKIESLTKLMKKDSELKEKEKKIVKSESL